VENKTSILRPGTARRFFARLRTASNIVRAPKSASALLIEEKPGEEIEPAPVASGVAFDAT